MTLAFPQISKARVMRHALFVGVNIGLLLLLYLVVVAPLRQYISDRADSLTQRRTILSRYEAVAARESLVQDYARSVAESNARGELIEGGADGIVAANLQARLRTLADGAGVTVRSLQVLPAKTLRGALLVGARVEIAGTIESVHTLARALEGDAPLLLVMAATMRGQAMGWGAPQGGEQLVEAQFDVYGGALSKERT